MAGPLVLPGATLHMLPETHENVSATQIRAAVERGGALKRLVPDAVAEYIHKEHALPQTGSRRGLLEPNRVDRMKKNETRAQVAVAVRACQDKKATNISILQLDAQASGFTDYFVLCSGANPRQVQAIADDIDQQLSAIGVQPEHIEGYTQAEWVLHRLCRFRRAHLFRDCAKVYDLERLWKSAKRLQLADLEKPVRKPAAKKAAAQADRAREERSEVRRRRLRPAGAALAASPKSS